MWAQVGSADPATSLAVLSNGDLGLTAAMRNGEEAPVFLQVVPEDQLQPCGLQVKVLEGPSAGSRQQADWHCQRQMLCLMTEGSVERLGQHPPSPAN